jgi:hypothetical protein
MPIIDFLFTTGCTEKKDWETNSKITTKIVNDNDNPDCLYAHRLQQKRREDSGNGRSERIL